MSYTYNQINNIIKSQTQLEYLEDSENFQSENDQIDFTEYNKNNKFIIYSYITENWYELRNLLNINHINYTELLDEFDNEFIIIQYDKLSL